MCFIRERVVLFLPMEAYIHSPFLLRVLRERLDQIELQLKIGFYTPIVSSPNLNDIWDGAELLVHGFGYDNRKSETKWPWPFKTHLTCRFLKLKTYF